GELRDTVSMVQSYDELPRDADARRVWGAVYGRLTEARPGLFGAVTSRAEAQVLRLSALYAALDQSRLVRVPHVLAALAVWDYAEASAGAIFGGRLGMPDGDRVVDALRSSGGEMDATDVSKLFRGHRRAVDIQAIGLELAGRGLIEIEDAKTGD